MILHMVNRNTITNDFVTLNREIAKIKNEEMMMRERDMMIEIETYPHL